MTLKLNNPLDVILKALKGLLPKSTMIERKHIANDNNLITILVKLFKQLPKILISNPLAKATHLISIGTALNNKVCKMFVPENLVNIKTSVSLQQVAFAYFKQGMIILYPPNTD